MYLSLAVVPQASLPPYNLPIPPRAVLAKVISQLSHWAGGVAAVMDPEDSYSAHVADTLRQGPVCVTPLYGTAADAPEIIPAPSWASTLMSKTYH